MREFRDIGAFLRFAETLPAAAKLAEHTGLREGAIVLETEARAMLGHYQPAAGPFPAWEPLADITLHGGHLRDGTYVVGKIAKGQASEGEDNPLVATGDMRDSIGITVGQGYACIGSDDPVAVDQEMGTQTIPPRSFLGAAGVRKGHEAVDIVAGAVVAALAGVVVRRNRVEGAGEPFAEHELSEIPF